MNIVVFTQGISPIVEPILQRYGISAIVESGPRGSSESVGHTRLSTFCEARKIPYYWLTKTTRAGLLSFLKRFDLDIAAVYSMSQLLPSEVLDLFPRGVINAHPSKLPAYRGPNPYFWTFYDGCRETALTIHYLDPGEDTGDVILQVPIMVQGEDSESRIELVDLRGKVHAILGMTMLKALEMIEKGVAPRLVQPKASPSARARNITLENVADVLSALKLPLERAAFFFQNTLDSLPLLQFGFRRMSGDWRVRAVSPTVKNVGECVSESWFLENGLLPDRIYWTRRGFAIARPDGWILLAPRINLAKFVLKLMRDWIRTKQ